ncbi:MAG: bile acid:sodium symporter [Anaeromyxobacteraceae bacterium]
MAPFLTIALKISLVLFMAGNLLEMGLKLDPRRALSGLRDARFVLLTVLWGFLLGPAIAYAITRVLPLAPPYAMGLILMGMAPCAPFLPMLVGKAGGDLGYTAAFMLLTAAGTVLFMPVAVPFLIPGMDVGPWAIARPLLIMVLLPLAVGMAVLRLAPPAAGRARPVVKKATFVATAATAILCIIVYGRGFLGIMGSLAVASQVIFFGVMTAGSHWLGSGLPGERRIVLSAGVATRNLGAALAPLFALPEVDQRAIVMVVLGLPLMVLFARLSVRWFGPLGRIALDAGPSR